MTENKKRARREVTREKKALKAADLDKAIKKELLERLQKGVYGDIYNFPSKHFDEVMDEEELEEDEPELEYVAAEDIDEDLFDLDMGTPPPPDDRLAGKREEGPGAVLTRAEDDMGLNLEGDEYSDDSEEYSDYEEGDSEEEGGSDSGGEGVGVKRTKKPPSGKGKAKPPPRKRRAQMEYEQEEELATASARQTQ